VQYETKTHKIHTDKQKQIYTVKWAQCDKTQAQLRTHGRMDTLLLLMLYDVNRGEQKWC